jgi:hypothetical protein
VSFDSEVRSTLRNTLARASQSKDAGKSTILVPLLNPKSATMPQCHANFGFAALVARILHAAHVGVKIGMDGVELERCIALLG